MRPLALASLLLLSVASHAAELFEIDLVDPRSGASERLDAGQGHHIVFIATWCPTCMDDLDAIEDLRSRFAREGYALSFVAVAHRQSPERLQRLLEQRTLPGRLLYDASGELQRALGAEALPAHVLIDREGRIGARAGSIEELVEALRERRARRRADG